MKVKLLGKDNEKIVLEDTRIIATAGKLSRAPGTVSEVYDSVCTKTKEENFSFIERVIGLGHFAVIEHISFTFEIEDVSPIVEQILIAERYSAFTIKSRREVDFSNAGFYIPNFYDKAGSLHKDNKRLQEQYETHMKWMFEKYNDFMQEIYENEKKTILSKQTKKDITLAERKAKKISQEDARYILPYCFHSNIIMSINAHTLCDVIISLLAGVNSNITELNELGKKLYEIMEESAPYLKKYIDRNIQLARMKKGKDSVRNTLESVMSIDMIGEENEVGNIVKSKPNLIVDNPILLSCTKDIDQVIFTSSLMRVFGYNYEYAKKIYNDYFEENEQLKKEVISAIEKLPGGSELSQINFCFQVPLSYAALTHLTRHRTHHLLIPDFNAIDNYGNYIIPKSIIASGLRDEYQEIYNTNIEIYNQFKKQGIREEDLIYFHLSGNMVNVITNMDGDTLRHITSLRCCNKAQWEIREVANSLKDKACEKSKYLSFVLGPSCEVYKQCYEGIESCGKIKDILKNKE